MIIKNQEIIESDWKNKLKEEGSELVSITNQLKMIANDGKLRGNNMRNTEKIII